MSAPLASADQSLAAAANQALALGSHCRRAFAYRCRKADRCSSRANFQPERRRQIASVIRDRSSAGARIDRALEDVVSLSIAVNADRHELVAGENFIVNITLPDQPAVPVKYTVDPSTIQVPSGWTASVAPARQPNANGNANPSPAPNPNPAANANGPYRFSVSVPPNAIAPAVTPAEAVLPFPPPLVSLALPVSPDDFALTVHQKRD